MDDVTPDRRELQISTVRENTKVIRRADNWQTLAFKESLAIKDRRPSLNNGIKAAKELLVLTSTSQIEDATVFLTSDKFDNYNGFL